MNTPTYEQQWQKITSAYLRNEIDPYQSCACFIGNLLGSGKWEYARGILGGCTSTSVTCVPLGNTVSNLSRHIGLMDIQQACNNYYSIDEICKMEQTFLRIYNYGKSEDSLFDAMVTALEVLREIHEAKGDETAQPIELKKRTLATA